MSWFQLSSIRAKLSVAFALVLALLVAIGFLGLTELRTLNAAIVTVTDKWLPKIEKLEQIKRLAITESLLLARHEIAPDTEQQKALASRINVTRWALRSARAAYNREELMDHEHGRFAEFESLWSVFESVSAGAGTASGKAAMPDGRQEAALLSQRAFDGAVAVLDDLIALTRMESREAAAHANSVYAMSWRLVVAAILLGTALVVAAVAWTTLRISMPLQRVSGAMNMLAAGNYSAAEIVEKKRSDEIGVLLNAYNGYRDSQIENERLAALAAAEHDRLHAAVSNMPIGLAMFDSDSRLIMSNDRYGNMYEIPERFLKTGMYLSEIMGAAFAGYSVPNEERKKIFGNLASLSENHERNFDTYELPDGRLVNITLQLMQGGGWVEVHEDITERRQNEAQIEYMAKHDALTELPNRLMLAERAEEALRLRRRDETVGVLCLDLDRFKNVNDTLGHSAGDTLLKMVAERLREIVRDTDTVARLGGDEFAVIQAPCARPEDTITLAHRILESISEAYEIEDREVVIGVSVGITTSPADGEDVEQLLKKGDIALYRAKSEGRGTFRFFEPEMDAWVQNRRLLELDMRRALTNGEFRLNYQPVVHVETDTVTAFEALIRWEHPERGNVEPSEFIPIAEEIGLIIPIGEWVLKQACHDAVGWPGGIAVAVNVSPAQFRSPAFLGSVLSALAVSKLPADRLEIEITEGVLMSDHDSMLALLHQLRARGVRVAMDDFGTGYSSLNYLRSFPFDRIKIDASFIRGVVEDRNSMAIIRATAGLGVSLGMATTAEGVETPEQLKRVREMGYSDVQGFFYSRPIPVADVAAFLEARKPAGEAAAEAKAG